MIISPMLELPPKGVCPKSDLVVACSATQKKDMKVNMMVKSFFTGQEPRERVRKLVLEEHTECGCQCNIRAGPEIGAMSRFQPITELQSFETSLMNGGNLLTAHLWVGHSNI